jgi:hypothetical protein
MSRDPYCPCAGRCHHSPNPCSLGCFAAGQPGVDHVVAHTPDGWRPRITLQRGADHEPADTTWYATLLPADEQRAGGGYIGAGDTAQAALDDLAERLTRPRPLVM